MKFDLRVLRTFLAVIDTGTVIEASRARGYSAAAVSRQIGSLQERLGVRLFRADGRSIAPTPDAIVLAERARLVVSAADAFEQYAHELSERHAHARQEESLCPAESMSV